MVPIYWKKLAHVPAAEVVAHRVIWSVFFVAAILAAGRGSDDPDRRIIAMLSARQNALLNDTRCSKIAVNEGPGQETRVISLS